LKTMLMENFWGKARCTLGDVLVSNWPFGGRLCFILEKNYCSSEIFASSVQMPKI